MKNPHTYCEDNIRLLIDGNGDRKRVLISTVSCKFLFSVFSRTCVELARGGFASYSFRLYIPESPQASRGINLNSKQTVTHINRTQTMLRRLFFRLSICLSCPPTRRDSMFGDFNSNKSTKDTTRDTRRDLLKKRFSERRFYSSGSIILYSIIY